MSLPPMWKVRREFHRMWVRTTLFASRCLYEPLRKPVYDLTARWRQRITNGKLPMTDRVAVFVVYQPKGIAASLLLTLDHLQENGFSVLLVSNGTLRAEDRVTLARYSGIVLERPNVGYDFGAYRDGLRHLWSLNHDLSLLVLMNDSTWFPLRRQDDSLKRMEALEADLAGHIYKIENEKKRRNDHIESHLLMVSRGFSQSEEFREFWSSYRMSNHRATTVEVGEKGLTQMALRSRRRVVALKDREWLMNVLHGLDDEKLRVVLDHTIDSYSRREPDLSDVRQRLAAGEPWREAFLDWTDNALRNSRSHLLSAAFVMPALVYGRMGFAKKANDIRFHMAREELLDLEASGMIQPLADEVRFEVAETVRNWRPPKGQEQTVRPRVADRVNAG